MTIAHFIQSLITVYSLIIFAHIVFGLLRSAGVSIPYSGPLRAVENFLHDASEPYLSIFRRFIPPLGGIDFSPMVAIIVLQVIGNMVTRFVA